MSNSDSGFEGLRKFVISYLSPISGFIVYGELD